MEKLIFKNEFISIKTHADAFLSISTQSDTIKLNSPKFEINNQIVDDFIYSEHIVTPDCICLYFASKLNVSIKLNMQLKINEKSPFIRFRYILNSNKGVQLTKNNGMDNLSYFTIEDDFVNFSEINEHQFSQYIPHIHSFIPQMNKIAATKLIHGLNIIGPSLEFAKNSMKYIIGYEHGAECPNNFLSFSMNDKSLSLNATKGNYYDGMSVSESENFISCWIHIGALDCDDKNEIHKHYREFFLKYMSKANESRKPYIFYNTWNYQERDHNFSKKPYLDRLNTQKVLNEIEVAHEIGVEYFVIDTGWYIKTGDWLINTDKFTDELKEIRKKLNDYGMKLGLWFNPTVAAKTSQIVLSNPEYKMTVDGNASAHPIWETEESYGMCLCSDYSKFFAQKLIELYKKLEVRYFKWDGIGQFGCNSPLHNHGNENNSPQERSECYSYQMGLAMIDIVDTLLEECPDAIVDFDITEAGRFVGLGFLSVGKYFLVNNGPYAKDFDLPEHYVYDTLDAKLNPWTNIFFYPGAARPRFCRTGISYDNLVPSILFLTHYLPDGDCLAQSNSIASMVLGGNGIWGDLSSLSEKERQFLTSNISNYKKVRDGVTSIGAITTGQVGSSPEIYEKIDSDIGCGLVSIFTCQGGEYEYITKPFDKIPSQILGADSYEVLVDNSIKISVKLEQDTARVIYFIN